MNQEESDAILAGLKGAMGRGPDYERIGLEITLTEGQEVDIADLGARGLLD